MFLPDPEGSVQVISDRRPFLTTVAKRCVVYPDIVPPSEEIKQAKVFPLTHTFLDILAPLC